MRTSPSLKTQFINTIVKMRHRQANPHALLFGDALHATLNLACVFRVRK